MEVSDRLNRAADIVIEQGWTQSMLMDGFQRVCVEGAIRCTYLHEQRGTIPLEYIDFPQRLVAVKTQQVHPEVLHFLVCAIEEFEGGPPPRRGYDDTKLWWADWNDRPGRKASEVVDVLRRAAILAKESETA